ncbi:GspH/FimT family pseudopilin [Larsenimonas suaedae]|uniref:GspH/FimT family pseudopilin n=2 Tax=Larsenimonas suaedae TaxID=1851019 RepID=UPI003D8165CD
MLMLTVARQRGFSLVSSLCALALAGLLTALSLAQMGTTTEREIEADLTTLSRLLAVARQSSRATQHSIRVCGSADGTHCQTNVEWQAVLVMNRGTDQIIARHTFSERVQVRWRGFRRTLDYHPLPWRQALNGRFLICPAAPKAQAMPYALVLNAMGRLRRERDTRTSCGDL